MEAVSPWEQLEDTAKSCDESCDNEFSDRLDRLMLEDELAEARRQLHQRELHAGGRSWKLLAAFGWLLALAGWSMYLCGGAPSELGLPSGFWQSRLSALASRKSFELLSFMQEESSQHEASWQRRLSGNSSNSSGSTSSVASSDSSASSSDSSASSSGHATHPHDGMYFLLVAMAVGLLITAITSLHMFQLLSQTVALFISGVLTAALMENLPSELIHESWQHSWDMWMNIDPHLLLFTMLPSLLMADAMTIDTQVAGRVAKQCIYLAGPGVAVSSFVVATFLWFYLPYNWPFLLCLVSGSILCATDPVAVVALLKELGASPVLTVQIQGEALLNDGTAIVLYLVTYSMLKGQQYEVSEFFVVLLRMALLAVIVGVIFGAVFYYWIKISANKFDHHSAVVQTLLTVACCYWSFCFSEGLLGVSGVLACVASALVLAYKMWPAIVDKASLMSFWHVFETLCNTVIFFLAGALTGKAMVSVDPEDYGHLCVLYIVLMVSRLALLLCSLPILNALGKDGQQVTVAEAMVMTWGGLRGAVGLSLAIQVANDRGGGVISEKDSQRVLFYVGGIALLTLVINATTCPFLVNALGITRLPKAKQSLLLIIHGRIKEKANGKAVTKQVSKAINMVLEEVQETIQNIDTDMPEEVLSRSSRASSRRVSSRGAPKLARSDTMRKTMSTSVAKAVKTIGRVKEVEIKDGQGTIEEFLNAYENWRPVEDKLHNQSRRATRQMYHIHTAFDTIRAMPFGPQYLADRLRELLQDAADFDAPLVRAFNEAFLKLVKHAYWKQIDESSLPDQSDGERLLLSLLVAQSSPPYELVDLQALLKLDNESRKTLAEKKSSEELQPHQGPCQQNLGKFLDSVLFSTVMTLLIIASAVVSGYEDSLATKSSDELRTFFILECFFMFIFTLECVLKLVNMKCSFFRNGPNVFDAVLVVLGGVGIVMASLEMSQQASSDASLDATTAVGAQGRLLRAARIFRVLRLVRLVRLYRLYLRMRAKLSSDEISFELSYHLRRIALLEAFVKAHVKSQLDIVTYFCTSEKICCPELARVLIQSQTSVYNAGRILNEEETHVGKRTLKAVKTLKDSMEVTREVEEFVINAHHAGLLGSVETESLLHPVHEHIAHFKLQISRAFEGWTGDLEEQKPPPTVRGGSMLQFMPRGNIDPNGQSQVADMANSWDHESSDSDCKSHAAAEDQKDLGAVNDSVVILPPDHSAAADRESPRVTPEGQNGSVSTEVQSHSSSKPNTQQESADMPKAPLSILPGTPHTESKKSDGFTPLS